MAVKQFFRTDYPDSYDVNQARYATAGSLLRITQETGNIQMSTNKPSYNDLLDQGIAFMVSRLDMVIHEQIAQDQEVTVTTYPCPSSRATFPRCYAILSEDRPMVEVSSTWVAVDVESRKILTGGDVDLSNYYFGEFKEVIDKKKFKITSEQDAAMEVAGVHTVTLRDTDCNGHMNNTYSLDMVCDYIPELLEPHKYRVKTVRLHFVNEAPIGDTLTIMRLKFEDKYLFKVVKADGTININCQVQICEA